MFMVASIGYELGKGMACSVEERYMVTRLIYCIFIGIRIACTPG